MQRLYKKEHGARISGDQGTDGSVPFLLQSPPPKCWELKGPGRESEVSFAHLEKPTRLGGPWVLPQSLELCPGPSPKSPRAAQPSPLHTEIFLTNFTGDGFSCSAFLSSFQNLSFEESCSQLMVLQSSQGFLPLRALSQNILFFPYSLCFNFSLTSFKVLKLGAKWATLSSECELRAAAYYKDNPKHPRFKKSVKHNAVIFKVCYKPTPYSNTNFFLPTKFSLILRFYL